MLTVNAVSLAVLVVSPQNPVIADGGATQAFTATGHFSDGSTQDLTGSAAWTSSITTVATMSGPLATSQTLAGSATAGFASIQAVVGATKGVAILSVSKQGGNGFAGVFTQHNDIARTGLNPNETTLTPTNVKTGTFGKKFSAPVDAAIYAQPLYVPNVSIGGGTHNVVYVVTEGDSAYAFDADTGTQYWHANMIDTVHGGTGGETTVNAINDVTCADLIPIIGITSTPVIDPSTSTMYVETKSKKTNGTFVHRLHGIDITTGLEKLGTPPDITGTAAIPGGGTVTFNAKQEMNRPGLLWLNGVIYVAYGSHCDNPPFFGWIFAYDATTLTQKAVWNAAPTSIAAGGMGSIWMAGSALAADSAGNIFISTGNGIFDTTNVPATQLGDSDVKLFYNGTTTFSLVDYFTPFNQLNLANMDIDLGSGGILLLPDQPGSHPHELVQAGKEGTIRLIDRDQMTTGNLHYCASNCNNQNAQIAQELVSAVHAMYSSPAYWNGNVYFCGINQNLVSFALNGAGMLGTTATHTSLHPFSFPGTTPSVSANGTANAIVWDLDTANNGANGTTALPAVLYAFDATNLNELYNSTLAAGDTAGNAVKFTVPTIANGRVYIGTATELDVYGP
jgi:outer membrane protein assembly factor BamB